MADENPLTGVLESYVVDSIGYRTIAEAYLRQAIVNQRGEVSNRIQAADTLGDRCPGGAVVSPRIRRGSAVPGKAMIARGRTPPVTAAVFVTAVAAAIGRRIGRARKRV